MLFQRLCDYMAELRGLGNAEEVLLDGSFTTAKDEPGDIDLIVVYRKTLTLLRKGYRRSTM